MGQPLVNKDETTDIVKKEYSHLASAIEEASKKISDSIIRTDVRKLKWLESMDGIDAYAKFECDQVTGSFKFRGAYWKLSRLQKGCAGVVAASAWNHWLAIAEAASRLGIPATICIPSTASTIKKEKLSHYGHSIVQFWDSLEEATAFAKAYAANRWLTFVSPFNDLELICGQGTLAKEFLDSVPDIDTLVVPLGGGGLASGIVIWMKTFHPHVRIVWVEPENYASVSAGVSSGKETRVVNRPTFADWLSVNLEPNSVTLPILSDLLDEIVTVSEEAIAAAALAILYRESKLVEPSWAISLAPVLTGRINKKYGKIGLVFSGWNVSTWNVQKIWNFPFSDKKLIPYTNYAYPTVEFEPKLQWTAHANLAKSVDKDEVGPYRSRWLELVERVEKIRFRIREYREYCSSVGIDAGEESLTRHENSIREIETWLADWEGKFRIRPFDDRGWMKRYRHDLQALASIAVSLDYRSAAYDQSTESMFFSTDSQDSPNVNYNRYESKHVVELEMQLSEVLDVDNERQGILVTSSGMAAFSLVESYLLRHRLEPGDRVYLPRYLYFEAEEQLSRIPGIKVVHGRSETLEGMIAEIKEVRPKAIFADPMTNTLDLRMNDLPRLVKAVSEMNFGYRTVFVIDGTMVSWAFNPFEFPGAEKLEMFYHESCSKYLQLGMDVSMWGVAVFDISLKNEMVRLRRNAGLIMYDHSVHSFPRFGRSEHLARMEAFTRNALMISDAIASDDVLGGKVRAIFPLSPSHPDFEIAKSLPFIGWIVTFQFENAYLNQRDALNAFIQRLLMIAKTQAVPIIKWVSFGFSLPRISAAAAMNETEPPFLRLSVWDRNDSHVDELAKVLIRSLREHLAINESHYQSENEQG